MEPDLREHLQKETEIIVCSVVQGFKFGRDKCKTLFTGKQLWEQFPVFPWMPCGNILVNR